jgi:bifunctional DNA-binding transcriptional regulator/antitoxin component of YhaV-PrlF toxin-antitoxin module
MKTFIERVSSDGAVTLPEQLKEELGIQNGDRVRLHAAEDGIVIEKRTSSLEAIFGSIPTPPHMIGRDIDEMIEEATADHAAEVVHRMRLGLE